MWGFLALVIVKWAQNPILIIKAPFEPTHARPLEESLALWRFAKGVSRFRASGLSGLGFGVYCLGALWRSAKGFFEGLLEGYFKGTI